ncbi:MAG: hypothetical protein A2660_02680 [Candidatus Doudnabacteria bacterium RIFCSPHIGHO2_01_FULL_45_18]|uniref:Uncharacterized protein n=1 Tax=Candidatus Doudnabacteria bacterium RIFCSPHIGHO2_01_FULL_45_18 TaxID=1817823 RepID=A0A1F5NQT0_9BACT|nr:MAG: hypothetical protein A2660_02680 [Candidatus Doudnabacteria bacterium RIFCSPHIGHO2_01_FULL_45_18]
MEITMTPERWELVVEAVLAGFKDFFADNPEFFQERPGLTVDDFTAVFRRAINDEVAQADARGEEITFSQLFSALDQRIPLMLMESLIDRHHQALNN